MDADTPSDPVPRQSRLLEVALVFTRLGFTAFGGPAAHVALMEEEFVHRRKWLTREHFLDLLSAVNFIPGPNSTELAIHLGLIRAGLAGLVTAGICFITPAVLIILPIAWMYVRYQQLPQVQPALRAVGAAIAAIVVVATWRLLKGHSRTRHRLAMVALSVWLYFGFRRLGMPQPDLLTLLVAAMIGAARLLISRGTVPMLLAPPLFGAEYHLDPGPWVKLFLFFFKIGITLFGSGYVLVTYLQTGLVDEKGWLTRQQMMDSIAVGQFTPGPLLTTATFIGYLLGATRFGSGVAGGALGAVIATVAIFLPAFLLIACLSGILQRLRTSAASRGVFDGLNDAVIGLLIATSVQLLVAVCIAPAGNISWGMTAMVGVSVAALLRNINATWVLLAALGAGAGVSIVTG